MLSKLQREKIGTSDGTRNKRKAGDGLKKMSPTGTHTIENEGLPFFTPRLLGALGQRPAPHSRRLADDRRDSTGLAGLQNGEFDLWDFGL